MDINQQNQTPYKQLFRSTTNRIVFGVCGGLGEYVGVDPLIARIFFVLLTFGGGVGVLLYLVLAFLVPKAPAPVFSSPSQTFNKLDLRDRAQELAAELRERRDWRSGSNWLGAIIALFGLMLLVDQLFPAMHWFRWNLFLAVAFIALGIMILTRSRKD